MIGAIGYKGFDDVIIFEVSDNKIYTFDGFKRSNGVRFAKHDVLQKKPVTEYIGADLDNISFKLILKAQFGISPRAEMDKLIKLQRDGAVLTLILDNKGFGVNKWVITSLGMDWKTIDNHGILIAAECDIQLQEYV